MDYLIKSYKIKKGKDIRNNKKAIVNLRRDVEIAKRALSSANETQIKIQSYFEVEDFNEILTRVKFEELNADLFASTIESLQKVLELAGITKKEVDEYVLIGGSTRIPKIVQLVEEYFDGRKRLKGFNPEEAAAYGAAIQARFISGEYNPYGLYTEPCLLELEFIRITIGIETVGGVMTTLIPRHTIIPTKKSQVFSTATENQTAVTIKLYKGERPIAKDNNLLFKFDLTGIPPAPRRLRQIEVKLEICDNNILLVSAEDKETGIKEQFVIEYDDIRLTPEERKRMIEIAERFTEEDKKFWRKFEFRNELEFDVHSLKADCGDNKNLGDKINGKVMSYNEL